MTSSIYNKQSFWRRCYCISKAAEFRLEDFEKEDLLLVDKYISIVTPWQTRDLPI